MTSPPPHSPRAILLTALLAASPSLAWVLDSPDETPDVVIVNPLKPKGGPPITVVGRLSRGGMPVPGVEVVAWKVVGGALHGSCGLPPGFKRRARPTAEDGSFELVVPGRGTYCWKAQVPGHDHPLTEVDIPDAPTHTLDIVLPPACLSGSVIDAATGTPVAKARVRAGGTMAVTSRRGRYHLDLQAGEHEVFAWVYKGGVAREKASVTEAGPTSVTLALEPGLTIAGRVVDAAGRGLAGVEVHENPKAPERYVWTKTGASGHFRIEGLPKGAYVLTAESKPRQGRQSGVEAGSGNVLLRLGNPGYLSVLVRGPQGQVVEGASVSVDRLNGERTGMTISGFTDEEGLAEFEAPEGTLDLTVSADVEGGEWETVGEGTVSVHEGESESTVITLRKQPLPPEP